LSLLRAIVLDFRLVKFIIYLKVSGRQDLENGVPVVLEVQNIIVGFIFGFDISKSFGRKESKIVIFFLVTLNENTLPKSQMRVGIGL
jgi:hypothetical protein